MAEAQLDLGRLLRLRGMVLAASQTDPTAAAAQALVNAYNAIQRDLVDALTGELSQEFQRLFGLLVDPPAPGVVLREIALRREASAADALTRLRLLLGWIQGLIDEQTLETQLRMEAEEKAKLGSKPPTGFGANS
jgi:hypothetical protein